MMFFQNGIPNLEPLRRDYDQFFHTDETARVKTLLETARLSEDERQKAQTLAKTLVTTVRVAEKQKGGIEALMRYYDLSCQEGVLLMCLAEALLRIPDAPTKDLLIRDKIGPVDWDAHLGESDSAFVNLATRGLQLSSKVVGAHSHSYLMSLWQALLNRTGVPVVRQAVRRAMKILSEQFVIGQTIEAALKTSKKFVEQGYSYSYDMLGEVARTQADADRYYQEYERAILAIQAADPEVLKKASISVKLSALHPRYEFAQREKVIPVLQGRLLHLCKLAKTAGIVLTVDAEETDRLDLSLDIIAHVFESEELKDWQGLGLALQAYQTRAFSVLDWLIALAQKNHKKIMVRLVKGAYWDSEIKMAQENGVDHYPVYTRKVNTDVSYLACARKMLSAPDAIYPQFATHNAYSVAAILAMMPDYKKVDFEFQNLQGMGKALHDQLVGAAGMGIACRIYAPVGVHEDLLPYLVRRLLENGANSSFINQIVDDKISIEDLIADPVMKVEKHAMIPHPKIPLPKDIYGDTRLNSSGIDFSDIKQLNQLQADIEAVKKKNWRAMPTVLVTHKKKFEVTEIHEVKNPSNRQQIIGEVTYANDAMIEEALRQTTQGFHSWSKRSIAERAAILRKTADLLEQNRGAIFYLIMYEAGRTLIDAMSELREAVDFCRYYAEQAEKNLATVCLPGPTGESNHLQTEGRGVIFCISPWNFPVAIFAGQIAAALVAGNAVLAKPADPTPLTGALVVDLMHQAGVPRDVLQLMPGRGSVVGQKLVEDLRVKGVMFTGSNATADRIAQTLATRGGAIVPLIAETGGMNAMIADSSALPEQLVRDVLRSAFGSAGQRCSALRILFVQNDIADTVIRMLKGAMDELVMGSPDLLSTDVGPIIDENARATLLEHVAYLEQEPKAHLISRVTVPEDLAAGTFFAPQAYELEDLSVLTKEVFGPILHVLRFEREQLDQVLDQINGLGYGLTFGVQSRIDSSIDYIVSRVRAGNIYVNRNMIGAVVGVQPFGGSGLSGAGPKAGGPHYLLRLVEEKTVSVNTAAAGGNAGLMALEDD